MKRKEYQIGVVLAAAFALASIPSWTTLAEMTGGMEMPALCPGCQSEMPDGYCTNTAVHADGIILEEAVLSTDPDSQMPAYEIGNAGQLAWFVKALGTEGSLVTSDAFLIDDIDWEAIDMAGVDWVPIGTYVEGVIDAPYKGVFNGNGYELSGLAFTDMETGIPETVFGNIGTGAVVKELGLTDIDVTSQASVVSVLAWKNQGQIKDCYINETEVTVSADGAVVSDIAAVNSETGTIENCYTAVSVIPGMKADQTGTAVLSIRPIYGENLNITNSMAIHNTYYLQTEDAALAAMLYPAQAGTEGTSGEAFADGSVAWKLNNGRFEAVFGQTFADGTLMPGLVRDESYYDEITGAWVEQIENMPVYRVTLDYTELEDTYFFVNDMLWFGNLPADASWQIVNMDGTVTDVVGDMEVTADVTLVQNIPVCQHEVMDVRDTVAATCTTPGIRETFCVNCGAVIGTEEVGAAHTWGAYVDQGNATCMADGTMAATCAVCGAVSDPVPNPGSMLVHSFTTYVADGNATCMADGSKTAYCDYGCGNMDVQADTGSKLTHVYTVYNYDNNATCQGNGTETALCDYGCGTVDTREMQGTQLSHSYTNYLYNEDATCQGNGTETALCDYGCGAIDTRESAGTQTTHAFENYNSDNNATCMADGTKTATCSYGCGTTDTLPDEGSMVLHSFSTYASNGDATCQADGTKTATCDYGCGTTDTLPDEGSKLAHVWGSYEYNNDATCTADGTETALCTYNCGESDTRTKEGSRLEHSFTGYVYNNDATCFADGTQTASCDYGCGMTDTGTAEGTRLTHSYTNYIYNEDATCQANGTETALCDHGCGERDSREKTGTQTAHVFENYTSDDNATCQADGTKTASCDYGCGTTDTLPDEGSKIPHSFGTYVSNGDATCTADGTKTAACDYGCGTTDTLPDEGSRLDHVWGSYEYNDDATCTADGTETAFCTYNCGENDSRTKEGSKLAHSFTVYVYNEDATCQKDGTETATCDYGCGEKDSREKAGTKAEHSYGEYVYNSDAGCLKNGTETAKCVFGCGESITREAEGTIIPHKFEQYKHNQDATCQVNGTETAVCAYGCGTEDTRDAVSEENRVPHKYEVYVYNDNATCQANGTETAVCVFECGMTDTREKEGTQKEHTFANGLCIVCGTEDETWIADDVKAVLAESNQGEDGWYRGSVTLNAPEGCYISTKKDGEFGTAVSVTVEVKNGLNNITYYLRRGNGKIAERTIQVKADLIAPTGTAAAGGFVSNAAVTEITFDKYFNVSQAVKIMAQDAQSGIKSREYLIVSEPQTTDMLQTAVWTEWSDSVPVKLDKEGRYIIYARLTDKAGNTAIINTNGMIFDVTAPVIDGIVNGSSVCPETVVSVTDANEITVTLNNEEVMLENGKLVLTISGAQTLKAVDKAGNQTVLLFSVKEDHAWDSGVVQQEPTCMQPGSRLDTCTLCNTVRTEELPVAGHVFGEYVYNADATCQADGTKTAACEFGCGVTDTVVAEGTRTDHRFTVYTYNEDATCQKDGTKTAACDYGCKAVYTVTAEGTRTDHKYSEYVYNQDATCLANGTKTALCDYDCGMVDTVIAEGSMTGHQFSSYVYNNDANCTADGTKTALCDFGCGTKDTITASGTRTAHTYGTDHICVICKQVDPATQPTPAPSNPNVPILGIEDFGGIWGIVLISAGVILLVIIGVVIAAGRKRR